MPFTLNSILPSIQKARTAGHTIVLATGVFDLLHQEHFNFIQKSKAAGDLLVVGLESDHRVTQLKGTNRPINSQETRAHHLLTQSCVDYVFILPEKFSTSKDHHHLISIIKPHILAVSSHTPHLDIKQKILKDHGGIVKIVHSHNPHISTTQILKTTHSSGSSTIGK